jgi:SAM-dependent methyltransferase
MQRLIRRLKARLGPALQSDTAFIESAYRDILGRPADPGGLHHYRTALREGVPRTAVLVSLMNSDEFRNAMTKPCRPLANLAAIRPDRYRDTKDRTNGRTISVFEADTPGDFDWLEAQILEHNYYEQPGVWNLDVDIDKRIIAEMVSAFAPSRALELGCAAGAVLECLKDYGIAAEGVEISSMAIERAAPEVRARIHCGDLLTLDVPAQYDLVFGLDIFEHLNPNRLDRYIERIAHITPDGSCVFCNIPAFGRDPIFGTVFPLYVDAWEQDAAAGRVFHSIHVDDLGYPIHGHLTWADASWWCGRFEAAGFRRELDIERAMHRKYDAHMNQHAPARKAYFVFSKGLADERRGAVLRRISERSTVLR